MDYEKKYKEALERARNIRFSNPNSATANVVCEEIFPELTSDDERIRKNIKIALMSMEDNLSVFYSTHHTSQKELLAWLEKQCEQPNKVSIWKHWNNGIAGNGEGKLVYLVKSGNTYTLSSCLSFECDYIELSELDNMWSWKTNRAIKTISNKQKAFEIANKDRSIELLTHWNKPSYYDGLLQGAMEAMEWKDEQYEQEKQQLIENVVD